MDTCATDPGVIQLIWFSKGPHHVAYQRVSLRYTVTFIRYEATVCV